MSTTSAFSLHQVVKRYRDFTLGPLDLTLEAGTVLGFIGPNGSGKTTTINCIAGLVVPDGGSAEVFGQRVDPREAAWKAEIGVVGRHLGPAGQPAASWYPPAR